MIFVISQVVEKPSYLVSSFSYIPDIPKTGCQYPFHDNCWGTSVATKKQAKLKGFTIWQRLLPKHPLHRYWPSLHSVKNVAIYCVHQLSSYFRNILLRTAPYNYLKLLCFRMMVGKHSENQGHKYSLMTINSVIYDGLLCKCHVCSHWTTHLTIWLYSWVYSNAAL